MDLARLSAIDFLKISPAIAELWSPAKGMIHPASYLFTPHLHTLILSTFTLPFECIHVNVLFDEPSDSHMLCLACPSLQCASPSNPASSANSQHHLELEPDSCARSASWYLPCYQPRRCPDDVKSLLSSCKYGPGILVKAA